MSNFNHPDFLHNSNPRLNVKKSKYQNKDRRNTFSFNNRNFNKKFFSIIILGAVIVATLNYLFITFFSFGPIVSSILVFINIITVNIFLSLKLTGPLYRVAQCFNNLQSGSNENVHLRKNDFYLDIIMSYNKYVDHQKYLDKNKIINLKANKSHKYTRKRKAG